MLRLLIHILSALLTRCPAAGRGVVRRGFGTLYQKTVRNPVAAARPGSRRSVRTPVRCAYGRTLLLMLLLTLFTAHAYAYDIVNRARIDAVVNAAPTFSISNPVTVVTDQLPTQAVVELLRHQANPGGALIPATRYSDDGTSAGIFTTILPVPGPGDLSAANTYSGNDLSIIRLNDGDRNTDPAVNDIIQLTITSSSTGDIERLELVETGSNTGIFLGYLYLDNNAPVAFDGQLAVAVQDLVRVDYTDPINGDSASDTTFVDPYGFVFDSTTGTPLDGLEVILIDNATGVEATSVVGDDGAPYPGRVITGSSFTAGSLTYNFPPGGYRFPTIPPGNYSLQITPPGNYNFPSLTGSPAGSYVVRVPESYGGDFSVSTGAAIRVDIPVDPITIGSSLWLQLSTQRASVGQGDFIPYSAKVENIDPARLSPGVEITQTLPPGFTYRKGTTYLNGILSPDPTISLDGRTLIFPVGDLSPGQIATIDFIATVTTAAPGKYPLTAQAADTDTVLSNQTEVTVLVRDELFTNRSFLAGRVVQLEQCGDPESAVGIPGVRIFLEDGTFVMTDSDGRYHIAGLKSGTHVAQLDPVSIPAHLKPVLCDDQTRFANTPSSRFVDLQGGTLWQADFYLADNVTEGEVTIRLDNRFGNGDSAIYTVQLSGRDVAIRNRVLDVTIPEGVTFLPGTTSNQSGALADPVIDGHRLTYQLDDPRNNWTDTIEFRTMIDSEQITREMRASARLRFDTDNDSGLTTQDSESIMLWIAHDERQEIEEFLLRPQFDTLDARLNQNDIARLDEIIQQIHPLEIKNIIVSGHTDARRIRWREGIAYKDNYDLSQARARAIADRLASGLDLDPDKIVAIGHAATVPIADNDTDEGRSLNRRTELKIYHLKRYPIVSNEIETKSGERRTVPTEFRPAEPPPPPPKPADGILSLTDGQKLAHTIETVRVRIDARLTPQLLLDGAEIPANRIGFAQAEEENGTRLLSYVGIDFGAPGHHTLQLKGFDPFGNARLDQSVNIIRTGPVARLEIADISGNVADGRTPIRIRVKLYDAADELIEAEAKLELRSGNLIPHQSETSRLPRTPETSMVKIDSGGIALFDPVNQSGRYPITLGFGASEVEIEIHVKPEQRDWILVGLANGTVGYNSISGNIRNLPDGVDEDFYSEGRVAFFARGQIKGEWLMTLAYDSDKDDLKDRSLHQVIDPDRYYTLYGDSTAQGYAASSSDKLYVRIEKDRFYAVYGDYETGLNNTELSRYSRSMTGLKSEYAGSNYGYNAFAAETEQAFIRDEIRGDGTSGLYRLSQNDIVINSDKVRIEVRDRDHSERIIVSRSLQRHIDYNIDFDGGTLYFKEPIVSRDENFNPVYIVIDYETFNNTGSDYQYGGRAYLRNDQGTIEVGATLIHEGLSGIETDLYGADATWHLSRQTSLRGEYATTDTALPTGSLAGSAWLAELRRTTLRYDALAYLREQQPGFGFGQQNAGESGSRKYGAEATWRFDEQLSFSAEAFRQDNLVTDANRTVAALGATYTERKYLLTGGLRYANDNLATSERNTSNQLMLGADWYATRKLTLRTRHEQSVGGSLSSDYPTRSLIGADYILNRMVTLYAEQEFTFGDNANTASSRVGLRATPWDGLQARTSVEQQLTEESRRLFANLGLIQTWQITPYWSADVSLDRSQMLSGTVENPIYPDVPPTSGSDESFTAISVGSSLRKQLWSWDNRIEFRTSDSEDHWGLHSGYMIEPRSGLGLSLALFLTHKDRNLAGDRSSGDLRFGLAWRPEHGRQIILNRLDLISETDSGTATELDSWRIVNRLKGHWRLTQRLNLALQYGSKYVLETFNGRQLSAYTDSPGGEIRYDLTRKWDIGLHIATLHQWESGQISYRSGASLGYSPATNLWVSLGHNLSGFSDSDLSGSDHTAQGAFLQFRFKFDQNSVRDTLKWINAI